MTHFAQVQLACVPPRSVAVTVVRYGVLKWAKLTGETRVTE
ncbi:hypothetical protein J3A74_006720 [Rhodococcus sp. PvP104]|jgi:hypothetical protein|nr:hypothetical protein [Rhodococcus sp. PvP104]